MKSYIRHLICLILWIGVIFVYPHNRLVDVSNDRDPHVYITMVQSGMVYMHDLPYPDISQYMPGPNPQDNTIVSPIMQSNHISTGVDIYTQKVVYSDPILSPKDPTITPQDLRQQTNLIPKHTLINTNLVSQIDHDILAYISKQDMTGLVHYLSTVSEHTTFSRLLSKRYIRYTKGRDLPASYRPGLVALSAYEQGYNTQARDLSYSIIKNDPGYILPHQLIAYTSIADASYIQAKKSLLTLIALDKEHTDMYRLLLGKVSYKMGQYTDTLIYLKQISAGYSSQDRDEYIRRASIALGESTTGQKI